MSQHNVTVLNMCWRRQALSKGIRNHEMSTERHKFEDASSYHIANEVTSVGLRNGWMVCEVWVDRWAEGEGKGGVRVGFFYIKDMYNNDVGKGGAYDYEAYEAK
jgi:hypothetical protein